CALYRDTCNQTGLSFGAACETVEHFGINRTRSNRVDSDAVGGALERCRFGQAFDCMLAGGVKRRVSRAALAHRRRDINNTSATLCLHHPHLMLHAEQGAEHVSLESDAIAFSVLLRHRTRLPFGPGIVDSDVEA